MAAPTWVAAGTKTEKPTDIGTTSTVAPPAGHAAGDLLVIVAHTIVNHTLSTPSGWALLASVGPYGSSNGRDYVFWKLATSSSEASVTLTSNVGSYCDSQMYAFRGVDGTTPFDVSAVVGTPATTASITTPAVTTVTNDCLLVYLGFDATSNTWNTPPAGATERVETTVYVARFVVATETKATAGTESADVYVRSHGGSDEYANVITLALRPTGAAAAAYVPKVVSVY